MSSAAGSRHRVVGFIDMDCFYVAVERARDPSLNGVPCAVVQYNPFEPGGVPTVSADEDRRTRSNGSIIAVSYEARAAGVTRQMRANEASRAAPSTHRGTGSNGDDHRGSNAVSVLTCSAPSLRQARTKCAALVTVQASLVARPLLLFTLLPRMRHTLFCDWAVA